MRCENCNKAVSEKKIKYIKKMKVCGKCFENLRENVKRRKDTFLQTLIK